MCVCVCVCVFVCFSVKVASTSNGSWRACLVHDKKEGDKNSDGSEPQQFIEARKFMCVCRIDAWKRCKFFLSHSAVDF